MPLCSYMCAHLYAHMYIHICIYTYVVTLNMCVYISTCTSVYESVPMSLSRGGEREDGYVPRKV